MSVIVRKEVQDRIDKELPVIWETLEKAIQLIETRSDDDLMLTALQVKKQWETTYDSRPGSTKLDATREEYIQICRRADEVSASMLRHLLKEESISHLTAIELMAVASALTRTLLTLPGTGTMLAAMLEMYAIDIKLVADTLLVPRLTEDLLRRTQKD